MRTGGGSAFTGLLDTYSGATNAYGMRKLSSSYNGSAINVRRTGGDTLDIGFDDNGNLDKTNLYQRIVFILAFQMIALTTLGTLSVLLTIASWVMSSIGLNGRDTCPVSSCLSVKALHGVSLVLSVVETVLSFVCVILGCVGIWSPQVRLLNC